MLPHSQLWPRPEKIVLDLPPPSRFYDVCENVSSPRHMIGVGVGTTPISFHVLPGKRPETPLLRTATTFFFVDAILLHSIKRFVFVTLLPLTFSVFYFPL